MPTILATRGSTIRLVPSGPLWPGVKVPDAAVAAARQSGTVAECQAALDLCGEEFLPDARCEDWATVPRGHALRHRPHYLPTRKREFGTTHSILGSACTS